MKFIKLSIPDLYLIKPIVIKDKRGFFMEVFHIEQFKSQGIVCNFKQDNYVKSKNNVLRGLHFQEQFSQAKLIKCLKGEIFDVCVDMRKDHPTYGEWHSQILSEDNDYQLFIPEGFAHGYYVMSNFAHVSYKCSEIYHPNDEGGIIWNDSKLKIKWPCKKPILSEKDKNWPPFN